MKVLQIVKTADGARWAFDQAVSLHKNGVQIHTVLPTNNGRMVDEYKKAGMSVIIEDMSLPLKKPWELYSRVRKIKNIVEYLKPDLIHTHFVTNILMLRIALRGSNIPRIFQVPGPLHLESTFYRNIDILSANNNDYWIGTCKKSCEIYIQSGIDSKRIFLSYYGGYGGKSCEEYSKNENILHKEFKIDQDKILVGMVSYFYKPKIHLLQTKGLKGHEDFIDAIAIARDLNPKIIGVIIGGPWGDSHKYYNRVRRYAEKKCGENIIFTGFRNDLKKIYKELDIAVHPSHSENLGGAVESLAAGVPTISTDVGGFPDIVINDVTGYTVPPKSSYVLAEAILKVINDPDKSKMMSVRGNQLVREMLDIDNTTKTLLGIYNKILMETDKDVKGIVCT